MRIIFYFICVLLIFCLNSDLFAQSNKTTPKFLFGLQGGGNFSKLKHDTISFKLTNVFLPAVGLNIRKPFTKKFSMQLGVQFSQRGANNENGTFKLRNKYIDLQLLGQVWFFNFLMVEGGFQYANLVKQEYVQVEQNNDGTSRKGTKRYEMSGYHSQPEFIVGTSIMLEKAIEVGVRYSIPYSGLEYSNFTININLVLNNFKFRKKKNKFKNLNDALENREYCHVLVLQRKKLEHLSPDIAKLENLEELVLDGNKLRTLPPEIGELKKLRKLSVQFNKLDSLPKEIGNLHQLQELYLHHNNLKNLPPEIYNLKNLRYFYIGKNQLESLSERLGELNGLIELDCAYSGVLLELPYSIRYLKNLDLLIIDHNTLFPIPYQPPNSHLKIIKD